MAEAVPAPTSTTTTAQVPTGSVSATGEETDSTSTQERPFALDDKTLELLAAARDKFMQDYFLTTHPLDHLLSKDGRMADPEGYCIHCGADFDAGAVECESCSTTAAEHDQEIKDFEFVNRHLSSDDVRQSWAGTATAKRKAEALAGKSSQKLHGL